MSHVSESADTGLVVSGSFTGRQPTRSPPSSMSDAHDERS